MYHSLPKAEQYLSIAENEVKITLPAWYGKSYEGVSAHCGSFDAYTAIKSAVTDLLANLNANIIQTNSTVAVQNNNWQECFTLNWVVDRISSPELLAKYQYAIDNKFDLTTKYKVLCIAPSDDEEGEDLAFIQEPYTGKCFVYNVKGLKVIL